MYGWLNADSNGTIRVREDGAGQRFEVGFIKRGVAPPPPITLTISDVEGTARTLYRVELGLGVRVRVRVR